MNVRIKKGLLDGVVNVPSSKSLTHRAIIAAALANGESIISNVSYSKDIDATIKAMESLGAVIKKDNDTLYIRGCYPRCVNNEIDCIESGSTTRFLIPLSILTGNEMNIIGHNKLVDRPLDPYFEIFEQDAISYSHDEHYLPLTVKGKFRGGRYKIRGDVSSQFITGLLFTLPLIENDSIIEITTKLESKSYIDLTIDILAKFGINITFKDNCYYIKGNQSYKPYNYTVEGDFSQAAFFLVADALGSNVKLKNLNPNSLQGDKAILDDLEKFGAQVIYEDNLYSVKASTYKTIDIDVSNTPDLGPILCVLLNSVKGTSRLINAERLRIKECDRITCVKEELNKIGFDINETRDTMIINGTTLVNGGIIDSHNDHRLVMAFSIAATISNSDIVITNAEAINKSYPKFFEDFEKLGGHNSYE